MLEALSFDLGMEPSLFTYLGLNTFALYSLPLYSLVSCICIVSSCQFGIFSMYFF